MILDYLLQNWQPIAGTLGSILMFFLGKKTRVTHQREAEFLAYEKKLENYRLEFEIKSQMLENLKKDYHGRTDFLKDHVAEVEKINKQLDAIIEQQEDIIKRQNIIIASQKQKITQYEQKFGTLETY
ncbi:hypothetical protein [Tenacibaculum geojense]|uniref:Uncharacterized protein n=1 Tax=Tenacibaculum geojense TaxID=915352 RepID=A0ABW3JR72_9FLAO